MKLLIYILSICAVALGSPARIVGGKNATEHQFPYQVFIIMTRGSEVYACGGSILDDTTILTAAHCVKNNKPLLVAAGNNHLEKQPQKIFVKNSIYHEDFDEKLFINDIAIVKLNSTIKLSAATQPIPLRKTPIGKNEKVVLAGWGRLSRKGKPPKHLRFVNLDTIDTKVCVKELAWMGLPITDNNVCTFTKPGEGACNGDSGGPLVDSNGEQVGIVSWGYPCALGLPDVFTKVSSYLDWIENNRH